MHMHDKRSNLAISPCTQHTDEAQVRILQIVSSASIIHMN